MNDTDLPPADQPGPAQTPANDDAVRSGEPAARMPRWLRTLSAPGIAPLVLVLVALAAFLPGLWTVPPLDRDEPRFAQASKQMLETGDFADIRFQEETRYKKPVGIYWLQAGAALATGQGAEAPLWAYRLPSQIGAILAVLLTFWAARAFTGPPQALLAGLFVALALIVGVEARLAKTDAVLLATIVAAQGALARIWLSGLPKQPLALVLLFWVALGLSILVKGPVGPMVVALTVAGLVVVTRRARWVLALRPLIGAVILAVLVAPWFIAIGLATKGAFFAEALGRDLFAKVGQGQEGHGAPPLTHLAAMLGTFWPLPAFLVAAAAPVWHDRRTALVQFCLAWVLPSWLVFELVATKLPHYTMPLLPALAILAAYGLARTAETLPRRWVRWIAAPLLALPPVAVAIGAFAGPLALSDSPSPPGVVLAIFAAIAGIYAARSLLKRPAVQAVPRAGLAALLLYAGVWGFAFSALTPIWISPRLADAVEAAADCPDPQVFSVGFNEPSFIFLSATDTRLGDAEAAAAWLRAGNCRVVAVDRRHEEEFETAAEATGLALTLSSRVQGLNINGGRRMDIAVYTRAGT